MSDVVDTGQEMREPVVPLLLGILIRRYRLRLKQASSGRPWAQEDLAVAIGSDKSHINRIERGWQVPTADTLVRICDALGLSWGEQKQLLGLAGYLLAPLCPRAPEVEAAVWRAESFVHAVNHPVYLSDDEQRVWDVNDLFARAFCGYSDWEACLREVRRLRMPQLLSSTHPLGRWWRKVLVDYDCFACRHLVSFRHTINRQPRSREHSALLAALALDERLSRLWNEIRLGKTEHYVSEYPDPQSLRVEHPSFGRYIV